MKYPTINRFQLQVANLVLELGPRYRRPQDDTTVLHVFHRTTNGGIGVLVERDEIRPLAEWLALGSGEYDCAHRSQTSCRLTALPDGGVRAKLWWNGSGSSRTIELTADQRKQLAAWLDDKDRHGWSGWRSGRTGKPEEEQ